MATVLLIDGDRNFREALAIALRLDGCAVVATGSAAEAAPILERGAFDLCLVDMNVDGLEGLMASAAARPVPLLVTGPYAELAEAAARRHPPAQALPKPFEAAVLLARLAAGADARPAGTVTSPRRWRPAPAG
jgi:DNA-binding response OmpR family regulator